MSVSAVGYSRFQAIVTAKPLNGIGPPVLPEPIYPSPHEKWEPRFQNGKRSRELDDAGSKQGMKKAKRTSGDDGGSIREVSANLLNPCPSTDIRHSFSPLRVTRLAKNSWRLYGCVSKKPRQLSFTGCTTSLIPNYLTNHKYKWWRTKSGRLLGIDLREYIVKYLFVPTTNKSMFQSERPSTIHEWT